MNLWVWCRKKLKKAGGKIDEASDYLQQELLWARGNVIEIKIL